MAAKKNHKQQITQKQVAPKSAGLGTRLMALILCVLLALGVLVLPLTSMLG